MDHTELDELDLRLLEALQRNARSTFADLASVVGLGSSAVHDRVKRLEQRGIVKGYAARLDGRRLGIELIAFVSVFTSPDVRYDAFTSAVSALPEIAEIHSVAGEEAFVLKVLTRSTGHLDDFLSRLKAIAGIARTKTTILKRPARRRATNKQESRRYSAIYLCIKTTMQGIIAMFRLLFYDVLDESTEFVIAINVRRHLLTKKERQFRWRFKKRTDNPCIGN